MDVNLSNMDLFNELAQIAEKTRDIISPILQGEPDVNRLGHCGLCGEFIHSFSFAIQLAELDKKKKLDEEKAQSNFKKSILECALDYSQLSASPTEISKEYYKNENAMNAISRSIQDLRDWMGTTDTLDQETQNNLEQLLNRADEIYEPIKTAIKNELKIA